MRISTGRSGIARIATVVAALVLVLQSTLVFAATPIQRDIFGNVICAPGTTEMPRGGKDGAKHLPECCLISCAAAFQSSGGLPPDMQWPAIRHDAGAAIRLPVAAVLPPHDRRTPANPRAPPLGA